jgi:hypothetical protein
MATTTQGPVTISFSPESMVNELIPNAMPAPKVT